MLELLNIFGSSTAAASKDSVDKKTEGDTPVTNERVVGLKTLILFGIALNFGGFGTWWNIFLEVGFYEAIIGALYMGVMYVLLSLTFAEMSSAVPFAGGSFGYVRCTLGPFWGYLVGASELLENFVFVCACVRTMGLNATIAFQVQDKFDARPSTFPVFFVALFLVHSIGGTFFWRFVNLFGLYAIGIVFMYLIISFRDHDLNHYAYYQLDGFEGDHELFLRRLHYLMGVYMGLQIMPLTSERIINVRKNLPIALVTCTSIAFVTEILMIVAAAGVAPGVSSRLYKTRCPLCLGFDSNMDLDIRWGNLLSMFLMWTLTLGYFYSCGHQMHAMAMSGLFPNFLRHTWGPNKQPVLCFFISIALQCSACVVLYYKFPLLLILKIVCIGASFVYIAMFAAYIVFSTRFGNLAREFRSPLGIPGAVLGMCMAVGLWIGTMFFQEDYNAMSIYLVYIGGNIVYYFAYVQNHQFFSEEEQNKFMKAYVLNANKMTKRKGNRKPASTFDKVLAVLGTYLPCLAPVLARLSSAAKTMHVTTSKSGGNVSISKSNSVAPIGATQHSANSSVASNTAKSASNHNHNHKGGKSVRSAVTSDNITTAVDEEDGQQGQQDDGHNKTAPLIAHQEDASSNNNNVSAAAVPVSERRLSLRWTGALLSETESKKMFQTMMLGVSSKNSNSSANNNNNNNNTAGSNNETEREDEEEDSGIDIIAEVMAIVPDKFEVVETAVHPQSGDAYDDHETERGGDGKLDDAKVVLRTAENV